MVSEDSDETYSLNNWLTHANSNLLDRIVDFISKNTSISRTKKTQLQEQLANIHIWNMDKTYVYGNGVLPKDETTMYTITQFMRESIYAMCRVYPEIIINNHFMNNNSHKHWGFAQEHNNDISLFIEKYYELLNPFKNDVSMNAALTYVKSQLLDVGQFLNLVPQFLSIHRAPHGDIPPQSYYSLFTKRTLYMIYSYIYYSVIYEYIKATDNDDILDIDLVERKKIRRKNIQESKSSELLGVSEEQFDNPDEFQYSNDILEVEIDAGNKEKIKKQMADLIVAFITMNQSNKKMMDLSYSDIEKRITRSKLNEKKLITDFLKNMDDDERRVEDTKKMLKLGRWNVGLRKGLVEYDKERYLEERNELFDQLTKNPDMDKEDVILQVDVSDIERQEEQDADEYGEEEANDLRGYYGDDADGAYYEEDHEDDFMED